jgi:hypothetical protein
MDEAVAVLRIEHLSPEGFEMLSHAREARTLKVNFPRVEEGGKKFQPVLSQNLKFYYS